MVVQRFLYAIDGISTWVGKLAAWLIVGLMTVVCIEVFKRYILNMPTAWIFDASNMFYGTLFMLCGAYTLAQNAHVRGDFLYSSFRPRTQATLDLILYFLFFLPGIAALVYAGYSYAGDSWRIAEHSNVTADGPPVYHFKTVIPIAGDQITNDIAMALRTPTKDAEDIKVEYGHAKQLLVDPETQVEVPGLGDRGPRMLSRQALAGVIEPRIEEIFSLVNQVMRESGYEELLSSGIVLTGGGSLLKNLDKRLREETGLPLAMAEDPLSSVVLGAGKMLGEFDQIDAAAFKNGAAGKVNLVHCKPVFQARGDRRSGRRQE